ncbi:MAG: hypothetical protein ABI580_10750 [Burkholderiaceae bacterium]
MTAADIHRTIDAIWRLESAKIIAGVARMVRDVGVAEEIAHESCCLIAPPRAWPVNHGGSGVSDSRAHNMTR